VKLSGTFRTIMCRLRLAPGYCTRHCNAVMLLLVLLLLLLLVLVLVLLLWRYSC
jgi:hypothetical protein